MGIRIDMGKPRFIGYDCYTGEHIDREMTDEEYNELLASGWTLEPVESEVES
jgi:hypothetical protein